MKYCIAITGQKFRQAQLPFIVEIFGGINFRECGKGCHILYVTKFVGDVSPMRSGGMNIVIMIIIIYTLHSFTLSLSLSPSLSQSLL